MASVIDTHPQRQKIIDAILAGKTLRDIAGQVTPKVSIMAIQRYRTRVVAPSLAGVGNLVKTLQHKGINPVEALGNPDVPMMTRALTAAEPFISRMEKRQADRDGVMEQAKASGDLKAWCAADRNDISATELHARLANALDSGPSTQVNMTFVSVPGGSMPAGEVIDIEATPAE